MTKRNYLVFLHPLLSNIMVCLPLTFNHFLRILLDNHCVIWNLDDRKIRNISLHYGRSTYQTFLTDFDFIKYSGISTNVALLSNSNRSANRCIYRNESMIFDNRPMGNNSITYFTFTLILLSIPLMTSNISSML